MKLLVGHLLVTALLLPLPLVQAKRPAISSSIRRLVSAHDDAVVAKKRRLQWPRFGRAAADDESAAADATTDDTSEKHNDDASDAQDVASPSDDSSDTKDDSESRDKQEPSNEQQSPSTNATRPSIIVVPSTPQPMRPVPHPYYIPHQQQQQQQRHHHGKRPSLLSSMLLPFLPKPSPSFPPNPYNHPSSPSNNNNEAITALLSLLLRLTLLSLSTHIINLFDLRSKDVYLPTPSQHYTFERVNDRYRRDGHALMLALGSPPPGVSKYLWKRVWRKRRRGVADSLASFHDDTAATVTAIPTDRPQRVVPTLQNGGLYNKTIILLDIKPDSRVGNGMTEYLRDAISFIIEQHRDSIDRRRRSVVTNHNNNCISRTSKGIRSAIGPHLEVLLLLDSPGGSVSDYGLASSQLTRLRDEPSITLSVCIDRIAASGGYMMACQATPGHLMAAPFAMVGSIGVLMETINLHDILNKYGVKPLTIQAGRHKAPLKTLGEVTDEEVEYAQRDAEAIHAAFQRHVLEGRPNVVASSEWMEKVCTGSVFLGREAVELGLIDAVKTSDEYIAERIAAGDRVLRLIPYRGPQTFGFMFSPLELLLSGMDAEGRARMREVVRGVGGVVASICRVGGAVGVLNGVHHLASMALRSNVGWTGAR